MMNRPDQTSASDSFDAVPNQSNKLTFRFAQRQDVPLILRFIRDLAEYEKMPD